MRKFVLYSLIIVAFTDVYSQEKGKIRVGADLGICLPNQGGGLTGNVDFRYNILDNFNAGFRIGFGLMIKDIAISSDRMSVTSTESLNNSFLITGDYYFSKKTSYFAPFIGVGLGTYFIENTRFTLENNETQKFGFYINGENVSGGLLRGGFEWGKFRLVLEYYLIPSSALKDLSNNYKGMSNNCYTNISLGFYIGGGKWKKLVKAQYL